MPPESWSSDRHRCCTVANPPGESVCSAGARDPGFRESCLRWLVPLHQDLHPRSLPARLIRVCPAVGLIHDVCIPQVLERVARSGATCAERARRSSSRKHTRAAESQKHAVSPSTRAPRAAPSRSFLPIFPSTLSRPSQSPAAPRPLVVHHAGQPHRAVTNTRGQRARKDTPLLQLPERHTLPESPAMSVSYRRQPRVPLLL